MIRTAPHPEDTAYGSPLSRGRQQWSIAQARLELTQAFRNAGLDTPDLDARILVGHALGLDHAALAARGDVILTGAEAEEISALAARRLEREPVARIRGVKEFWGLPLRLNAETLVPRPETETVVEAALEAIGPRRRQPLRVADLGTGTGALALALLSELPAAHAAATDLSPAALTCARDNAMTLGLGGRATFVACDYGAALHGSFDLVVCNPPYISDGDLAALAPEVRVYDPARALAGGADGLAAYRALAADARRLIAPDGVLVLELGAGQAAAVNAIFTAAGLMSPGPPRHDLGGVARALVVKP